MRLRICNRGKNIGLSIPLFLLLPPIVLLVLMLVPLVLVAALLLWYTGYGRPVLLLGPALYRCICALRGLEIDVNKGSERVFMSFR
jgi:hypothetical protein